MTVAEPAPATCLIATGSRQRAEAAARAAGLEVRVFASKSDCRDRVDALRREVRRAGIDLVAIHSEDWERQPTQQLFELAAARLGVARRRVLVGEAGAQVPLSRGRLAARLAAFPFEVAGGLALGAVEAARFVRHRRATMGGSRRVPPGGRDAAVLAIWRGSPDTPVGGSVTHISGILAGFRQAGVRVGLLTSCSPPAQLASLVDDLEVAEPLPPTGRVTRDLESLCANRPERAAGKRLLARLRPAFVYQRYDGYVTSGVELARAADLPLVLEWNSSEVWVKEHWVERRRFKRLLDPVLQSVERYSVEQATLVAAVSGAAADMAVEAGARPERVMVVPNGVDLQAIDDQLPPNGAADGSSAATVGWVGTFGPWHGAEVLVSALSMLPTELRLVLVGTGAEEAACRALAQRLGVCERIEWTGQLPHREAIARLAGCDVLASPHVPLEDQPFFGSPTKLFEYLAIGRPIVASALEQLGDVLEDGRTARLVKPGDPADLAEGIRHVLSLPDRGAGLGRAARAEAETNHTWDHRARAIVDRLVESGALDRRFGRQAVEA